MTFGSWFVVGVSVAIAADIALLMACFAQLRRNERKRGQQ